MVFKIWSQNKNKVMGGEYYKPRLYRFVASHVQSRSATFSHVQPNIWFKICIHIFIQIVYFNIMWYFFIGTRFLALADTHIRTQTRVCNSTHPALEADRICVALATVKCNPHMTDGWLLLWLFSYKREFCITDFWPYMNQNGISC